MNNHVGLLVALSENLFTANGVGLRIFNAFEASRLRGQTKKTYEAAGRAVFEEFVHNGGILLYLLYQLQIHHVLNAFNPGSFWNAFVRVHVQWHGIKYRGIPHANFRTDSEQFLEEANAIRNQIGPIEVIQAVVARAANGVTERQSLVATHRQEVVQLQHAHQQEVVQYQHRIIGIQQELVDARRLRAQDDANAHPAPATQSVTITTDSHNTPQRQEKSGCGLCGIVTVVAVITSVIIIFCGFYFDVVKPDATTNFVFIEPLEKRFFGQRTNDIPINPITNKDDDVTTLRIVESSSVTNIGTADSNGTISVNLITTDNDVTASSIIEPTSNKEDAHSITDPVPVTTIGMTDPYKESDGTDYSVSGSNVVTNKEENDTSIDPTAGTTIGMVDANKKIEVAIDSSAVGSNVVANTDDIDTLTDPTAGTTIEMVDPNKKMDGTEAGSNIVTNEEANDDTLSSPVTTTIGGGREDPQKEIERDDSSAGANIAHEEDNGALLSLSAVDAIEMSFLMSFGDKPKNGSMGVRTPSEEYLRDDSQPLSSPPRDDNNEANDETIFELPSLGGENFGDSNQLSSDPPIDDSTSQTCPIKVDSHDPPFPTLPNLTLSQRFNESHFVGLTLEEPSSIVEEPYEWAITLSNMFCYDTCGIDTFSSSYLEVYHDHEQDLNVMIDHGMTFLSNYCCYDSNIHGTASMIFDELMYDYYNANTLFGSLRSDAVTEDTELMTVIDDRMSMVSGTAATDDHEDKTTLFDNYGMTLMFDHCCYDSNNINGTSSIVFDELMRDHYTTDTSFVFLRSDDVTEDTELMTLIDDQVTIIPDTAIADHEDKTTLFDDYGMTLMFDHCCYDGDINGVSSVVFEKTISGNGNWTRFDADNIANSSTSDDNNGPSAFQSGVYFEYITTLVLDLVDWFKKTFTGNGNRGVNDDLFTFESINSEYITTFVSNLLQVDAIYASNVLWNVFVVIAKIIAFFIVFIFFGCWYLPRFLWWAEGIVCGLLDWEQIFYQPVLNHREKIIWVYNLFQRVGAFCCKPLIAMNRIIQIRRGPMNNAQELQHLDDDDDNNYM